MASAVEVFTITASFTNDDFALAEFAARLESCTGTGFSALDNELKADCISKLISQSAKCSLTDGAFVCVIDGVSINTADIIFECGGGVCPSAITEVKTAMDLAASCAPKATVAGFVQECYTSAYCLIQGETTVTSFGDFCPSLTGEYCCEAGITRDNGAFPVSGPQTPGGDTYRRIDHAANMDFKIFYDVAAPAQLQLKVEVPFVEPESQLTYTENGTLITTPMCPTSYLIDFEPPVETFPQQSEGPDRLKTAWLPLTHFPHRDLVGRPRSTCGNYDMDYANAAAFVTGFTFPAEAGSFTYGAVPAVTAGVWDTTQGTKGIPHGSVTFWNKEEPVGAAGEKRLNYTVGDPESGYFDLVKAWTKCKNLEDDAQLVRKTPDSDETFINGVSYPIDTYEWTLSVCAVGYFGLNCRTRTDTQMYAKTCRQVPASFSITPQQIAHVTVSPVTEQLVSKTFLQTVDAFPGNCPLLHERVAITLNLVMFGTNYEIVSSEMHDLVSPAGVFEDASATDNFAVTESTEQTTFADYLAAQGGVVGEGVVVLKQNDVTSGAISVYYRKVVIVSKCFKTEWNAAERTRANPGVFADAMSADGGDVLIDFEIIVEKDVVDVSGVEQTLSGGGKIRNTLNLRILATKETFFLPTENKLEQKDVTAYQKLYGQYETAKLDTGLLLPNALPDDATLDGGSQLCSKHQLIEYDAQTANLLPNAVGACMLRADLDSKWDALKGTTIKYRTTGMQEPADYTYGCFPDWIDVAGVTPVNGVYVFSGPVPRVTDVLESMFWFVQKQVLETTQLLANEFMSDRFATALFWFNTTATPSGGEYVITKSPRFEHNTLNFDNNPAGCVNQAGAMKSSCNLVCFDLVEGLLTDPDGLAAREVLVHHVSVATVATEVDTVSGNKFSASRHRRMLLQSVASTAPFGETLAAATAAVRVSAMPRDAHVEVHATYDRDSVSGPKNFQMWFYPVFFIVIFVAVMIVGCVCAQQRYKLGTSRSELTRPFLGTSGNKMFE